MLEIGVLLKVNLKNLENAKSKKNLNYADY